MTSKKVATIVEWYEVVKYLTLGDNEFNEWTCGFFRTKKEARAVVRKKRYVKFVAWDKLEKHKLSSKRSDYFCTVIPRSVALDQNSENSGQVLSRNAVICDTKKDIKPLSTRLKKKTTR